MKTYDLIVPFGNFCLSSGTLRHSNLQFESFPFDWVCGVNIPLGIQFLRTNFTDFFNLNDLELLFKGETHDRYRNTRNGIEYAHDFGLTGNPADDYVQVRAKYQRRINRLQKLMLQSKRVLLVHSSYDKTDPRTLEEMRLDLSTLYPNATIDLLYVEINDGEPGRFFQKISTHIDYWKLTTPCHEDWIPLKADYVKIYQNYRLSLRSKLRYFLPNLKFRLKKHFFKAMALLTPVPAWKKYFKSRCQKTIFE